MNGIADVIGDYVTGTYVVTRTVSGGYVNGRAQTGVQTTFNLDAVVVPAGLRELLRLEEGERTKESKLVITQGTLRTAGGGFDADIITMGADTFQVADVEDWGTFGFIKATVVKRGNS